VIAGSGAADAALVAVADLGGCAGGGNGGSTSGMDRVARPDLEPLRPELVRLRDLLAADRSFDRGANGRMITGSGGLPSAISA
jgi:hypothetical protein